MKINFFEVLVELVLNGVKNSVVLENRENSIEFLLTVSVERDYSFTGVVTLDGTLVLSEDIDKLELPDLDSGRYPTLVSLKDIKTLQFSAEIDNLEVRIFPEGKYNISFGELKIEGNLADSTELERVC